MRRHESDRTRLLLSCDTAVALADVTDDGSVLLAKNSDRASPEAQRLIGVPACDYDAAAAVQCQYICIPQVAHTAALIGSQPYWLWGFEHGVNEHGVAIGNEAIFTRETPQETGLLGMDLLRLGLERGATARDALDTITALLERFGQGGSAAHHDISYYDNAFLIADPREVWVLETSGRRWVARRLTRGTYAISNQPTISTDYDLSSADVMSYAKDRGWWPRGRRSFDFAAAYTDPGSSSLASASCRRARSLRHLARSTDSPSTVRAMMALLRDHGADPTRGSVTLSWPSGEEVATVCAHGPADLGSTAASMVAHLTRDARPICWTSMGPPCTAIFVPCWVDAAPPALLAQAGEEPSATSPWWRYRHLWESVAAAPDPAAVAERVRRAWRPVEERIDRRVAALAGDSSPATRHALSEESLADALEALSHLETELAGAPLAVTR